MCKPVLKFNLQIRHSERWTKIKNNLLGQIENALLQQMKVVSLFLMYLTIDSISPAWWKIGWWEIETLESKTSNKGNQSIVTEVPHNYTLFSYLFILWCYGSSSVMLPNRIWVQDSSDTCNFSPRELKNITLVLWLMHSSMRTMEECPWKNRRSLLIWNVPGKKLQKGTGCHE